MTTLLSIHFVSVKRAKISRALTYIICLKLKKCWQCACVFCITFIFLIIWWKKYATLWIMILLFFINKKSLLISASFNLFYYFSTKFMNYFFHFYLFSFDLGQVVVDLNQQIVDFDQMFVDLDLINFDFQIIFFVV